jgi:hypothetical protein
VKSGSETNPGMLPEGGGNTFVIVAYLTLAMRIFEVWVVIYILLAHCCLSRDVSMVYLTVY